jgi:hypothetical protein
VSGHDIVDECLEHITDLTQLKHLEVGGPRNNIKDKRVVSILTLTQAAQEPGAGLHNTPGRV